MYPFRILMVRKDDAIHMRIVYQEGLPSMSVNGVRIKCCSCPELDVDRAIGTIFLRGDTPGRNHRVHKKLQRDVSADISGFFNNLNNQIKTHVSI
jgi:hypothetical protein